MFNVRRSAALTLLAGTMVLGACSSTANIPTVVCVGAATTYLDWLNGEFQPDVA